MLSILRRGAQVCMRSKHATRNTSSLLASFNAMVKELPQREAVRYAEKNAKWSADEFEYYADAHGNALLDQSLAGPGNTVLVWMEEGMDKAGCKIVDLDTEITDINDIREALRISECRLINFASETSHDRTMLLRKAIPEFYHYNDHNGQLFHSKHFPKLLFFMHTGFDNHVGVMLFKRHQLPRPPSDANVIVENLVDATTAATTGSTPLYRTITKNPKGGVTASAWATHDEVLKKEMWPWLNKLISKQYFEF